MVFSKIVKSVRNLMKGAKSRAVSRAAKHPFIGMWLSGAFITGFLAVVFIAPLWVMYRILATGASKAASGAKKAKSAV